MSDTNNPNLIVIPFAYKINARSGENVQALSNEKKIEVY